MQTRSVNTKILALALALALTAAAGSIVAPGAGSWEQGAGALLWLWLAEKERPEVCQPTHILFNCTNGQHTGDWAPLPLLSLFGHIPQKTRLTANELLQLSSCHFSSAFGVVVLLLSFFHYSGESEKNDENKVQVYRAEAANVVLVFSLSYSSLFYFHLNLHILLNGQRTGLV